MVITVTLNPAMDKTLIVDNFRAGVVNRASGLRYDIGGKGINVSKVLKNLDIDSVSTGFLGGIWENSFKEELEERKIAFDFVHIGGNTRTNTKIVDNVNKMFTDVNESGPEISKKELDCLIQKFSELCKSGDIVVLSGGVSSSIPTDIYKTLTETAKKKGAFVILDADGDLLSEGIKALPHAIKPNEHELGKLLCTDNNNRNEIVKGALRLKDNGISRLMISLGSKGAIYISDEGVYFAEALEVEVKGTVGAGDSMVAGLIYSIINKLDAVDTLKFATACGAASVTLDGTEACTLGQVQSLFNRVNVMKIEEE
jgi:1-phosphofructokinase